VSEVPAILHDASGLVATVERAKALLDEGDVIAAKVLAAHAYDDAKSAVALAERFKAGNALVDKARRLQGDALLIETRAKIRLADEWDAATAAGLISKGGRPTEKPVDGKNGFSAAEAGLDRKEIHEARKLRNAEAKEPGIVERAIAARLSSGLNPSRANLRAAVGTASATAEERGKNFYETPIEATHALLVLERFEDEIWEPACGKGAISRVLEAAGYDVHLSDIEDRGTVDKYGLIQSVVDFMQTKRTALDNGVTDMDFEGRPDIVTNPPYGADLNAFVAHALREHRPRKMAMLLNLNFVCGFDDPDRNFVMDEMRPARIHVFTRRLPMMHRDGWTGPEASSRMNTAWFVWEQPHERSDRPTVINRFDWQQLLEEEPRLPRRMEADVNAFDAAVAAGRLRVAKRKSRKEAADA
jgi:hypothetical protein